VPEKIYHWFNTNRQEGRRAWSDFGSKFRSEVEMQIQILQNTVVSATLDLELVLSICI
jgi:hypothetical protein